MPYEVLPRLSAARLNQLTVDDLEDGDYDDHQVVASGGEEDDHDDDGNLASALEMSVGALETLAGALEMLPIPCTISCAPGVPAILLVNPPTEIGGAADEDEVPDMPGSTDMTPEKTQVHNRHVATSSTLKRLSVTRMNFYMKYLQPKSRRTTQRERKATKTLAIVLGSFTVLQL